MQAYKDIIPQKAKKDHLPHFIWMGPLLHKYFSRTNNALRAMQSRVLEELLHIRSNMTYLKMIKIWDFDDPNLFLKNSYRFTDEGLNKYWASVDSAIRYWDIIGSNKKKMDKRPQIKPNHKFNQDIFHWHSKNVRQDKSLHYFKNFDNRHRRILPTPP